MVEDVTEDDVEHISSIARVGVSEEEKDDFIRQFQKILERFEKLERAVDEDIKGNQELTNVVRPDEVRDSISTEQVFRNAEETDEGYFEGPPVS
jgi:aspartyl-tRNA(Asn)/glutamyl-tRNA(Gln) amidotransferase subunit C